MAIPEPSEETPETPETPKLENRGGARAGSGRKRRADRDPSVASGQEGEVIPPDNLIRTQIVTDGDGHIIWDKMRDGTKGKVREILAKNQTKLEGPVLPDQVVSVLFDLEGFLKGWGFSKVTKIPREITRQTFAYGQKQKEMLIPAAQDLLKRIVPTIVSDHPELAVFLAVWTTVTLAQVEGTVKAFQQMQLVQQERKAASPGTFRGGVAPAEEPAA